MPCGPSSFRAALCAGQHGHFFQEGRARSHILLYFFKPSISRQRSPGLTSGRPSFHPFPLAEGWGEARQFGSLPTTCLAQRGDLQVSARPRLWSGARAEGNASAWDCRWPHAGLYPKHLSPPQTGSDLSPAWVTFSLLPAPSAPLPPLPRALNPLGGP